MSKTSEKATIEQARQVFEKIKKDIDKITQDSISKTDNETVKIMLRGINVFWRDYLDKTLREIEKHIA